MKGGTLFSGIGAPEVAMPWVDWRWCAEIDAFASAVHKVRFPGIPNLGDVNEIEDAEPVDLVVFGSPCQSFSVAGLRLGLDDPRGNLALVGLRVIGRIRPRWVVWENVPGVLSSDGGRDFAAFLGLLGELGYGFAYAVLDAQHFGVPQRRRRVFVVASLGDWRGPAAVLFEPESLRGDSPPRREAGQGTPYPIAPCVGASGRGFERPGDPRGQDCLIAFGGNNTAGPIEVATACNAHGGPHGRLDFETETPIAFSAKDHGADHGDIAPTPRAGGHDRSHANAGVMPAIAFQANARRDFTADEDRSPPLRSAGIGGIGQDGDPMFTQTGRDQHAVMTLAIRGRGDSHDLEWRDDGTANAVLTPNGGRAGIGVGAVAFDTTQITTPGNVSGPNSEDTFMTLGVERTPAVAFAQNGQGAVNETPSAATLTAEHGMQNDPYIRQEMSVRRLTPRECERLQGLPDVKKHAIIFVCSGHLKTAAPAETQNPKLPPSASPAGANGSLPLVGRADEHSSMPLLGQDWPVALHVLIDLERTAVEIRRAGKLLLSASGAERSASSPLPVTVADIARHAALLTRAWEPETAAGRAASQANNVCFSVRPSGSGFAAIFGHGTEVAAACAVSGQSEARFTISPPGDASQSSEQTPAISSCFVMAAISGFIPEPIRKAGSYAVRVETRHGYTAITYRGKPVADGPRYRAIGNSMAVPVVAWIGHRIRLFEELAARPVRAEAAD